MLNKSLSSHHVGCDISFQNLSRSSAVSFHINLDCFCFTSATLVVVVLVVTVFRGRESLVLLSSLLFLNLFFILPTIIAALTAPIELPAIISKRGLFSFSLILLSSSTSTSHKALKTPAS